VTLFAIHEFLYRLRNDAEFDARTQVDPERALSELDLTGDERAELAAGDVRALYERGVHAYLLLQLASSGLFGLTRGTYAARMRGDDVRRGQ
jgi:hypothetical protein